MIRHIILISAVLVAFVGCKSKPKPEASQQVTGSAGVPSIDSTAMSFDAAGSDSGNIAGLRTVQFEYDKSSLSNESRKVIQGNVEWMKSNSARVQIEGHTDSRGSIEYNVALGERRANSVKNYMISLGISADRLSTISYGEEKPLDSAESDAAWAKNRRANFLPVGQ
jgi:peptidoglycan-associated lipoprotein